MLRREIHWEISGWRDDGNWDTEKEKGNDMWWMMVMVVINSPNEVRRSIGEC